MFLKCESRLWARLGPRLGPFERVSRRVIYNLNVALGPPRRGGGPVWARPEGLYIIQHKTLSGLRPSGPVFLRLVQEPFKGSSEGAERFLRARNSGTLEVYLKF